MAKTASKAQLNREITRMIRSSDKIPFGLRAKVQKKTRGLDTNLRKKGLRLPWLLLGIVGLVIVVVYFIFLRRSPETEIGIHDIDDEDFEP